jgi:hypothetical protein
VSTSYTEGPILFDETEWPADRPLGPNIAQNIITNGLSLADQAGQVRLWWESPAPTTDFFTPRAFADVDDFHKIVELGPFSLLIRENGAPYNVRVRIAGFVNQASSVAFRLKLAPTGTPFTELFGGPLPRPEIVFEVNTSATSHLWIPATQTLLEPEVTDATDALGMLPTISAIGGDPIGLDECLFSASIWASTSNVAAIPRLTGWYLAEFHPPPP